MDLKFELSQNSIQELGKIIQEAVKKEVQSILNEIPEIKSRKEQIFLNRKQACKLLGCSLTTLYHYQKDGLIPYHQVGRKILFDKEELLKHLKINSRF